jgi:CBS domain-containing protein
METTYAARDLGTQGRLSRRLVTEVMRRPAPVISGRFPLHQALATMVRLGARHVVVVDDDGRCLGVLSDRAVVSRWAGDPTPLLRQTVMSALDARPAIVASNAVVAEAARFMLGAGIHAVAVADPQGYPMGILTEHELLGLLCDNPVEGGEHP